MGCDIEKDLSLLEISPHAEDDGIVSKPICPLLVVECQGPKGWRAAAVCHGCFHRLEVDMWINDRCWASLHPRVPYEMLPALMGDEVPPEVRWDPASYAAKLSSEAPQATGNGELATGNGGSR